MENYLNILHFCFYKAHYKLHLISKKLNPFRLLSEIPFVKKRLDEKVVNIDQSVDKAFGDKNWGLSITVAGGILWGWIAVFFFSLLIVFNVPVSMLYIMACGVLSGVISYFFVFRNDKYITYFDKYEKRSKAEKRKYGWFTMLSIVAVFLLFYLGLKT